MACPPEILRAQGEHGKKGGRPRKGFQGFSDEKPLEKPLTPHPQEKTLGAALRELATGFKSNNYHYPPNLAAIKLLVGLEKHVCKLDKYINEMQKEMDNLNYKINTSFIMTRKQINQARERISYIKDFLPILQDIRELA